MPSRVTKPPTHRDAERAHAKQREAQQRMRRLRARARRRRASRLSESEQQHGGRGDVEVVLAENLQQPRQQRRAGAEQDQADDVERPRRFAAVVGHVRWISHSATRPTGTLTKKMSRHDSQCTIRPPTVGPEQRADQGRNDDEVHRPQQLRLGKGADDRSRPTGIIIAARDALRRCARRPASARSTDSPHSTEASVKRATARGEDAARAEAVGDPAADRDADGEAQDVAGDDRLQAERRDAAGSPPSPARRC